MDGNRYGLVTISMPRLDSGPITFKCRDQHNEVPVIDGQPMRSNWDLERLLYK